MAHFEYHNSMRTVMESIRSTHIQLIGRICSELGAPERSDEMVKKYVDDTIRIKKFKDKSHPKKPKSGYMLYCEEHREKVKSTLDNGSFSEVIKKMAKNWNSLDESGKAKYFSLAEEDKGRYARELEDYKSEIYKYNVSS